MLSALNRHAFKLYIRGYGKRFFKNEHCSKQPEISLLLSNIISAEIVREGRLNNHYKVLEEHVQANMQHMRRMKEQMPF